jgi:hypothetical protein
LVPHHTTTDHTSGNQIMDSPDIKSLESLPSELVGLILVNLSSDDLIKVGQASQQLKSFIDSWNFWADKAHHDFNFPRHLFLKRTTYPDPQQSYQTLVTSQADLANWLIASIIQNRLDIVKYLSEKKGFDLSWALEVATRYGRDDIMAYLKSNGAQYTDIDMELADSAEGGLFDRVKELIAHGATDFHEAMMGAITVNRLDIVQYLVEQGGGDLDLTEPLLAAASMGDLSIVQYLISQDAEALTWAIPEAINVAQKENHPAVAAYLESHLN